MRGRIGKRWQILGVVRKAPLKILTRILTMYLIGYLIGYLFGGLKVIAYEVPHIQSSLFINPYFDSFVNEVPNSPLFSLQANRSHEEFSNQKNKSSQNLVMNQFYNSFCDQFLRTYYTFSPYYTQAYPFASVPFPYYQRVLSDAFVKLSNQNQHNEGIVYDTNDEILLVEIEVQDKNLFPFDEEMEMKALEQDSWLRRRFELMEEASKTP